jgi:phytoene dehydrogenase-like protein
VGAGAGGMALAGRLKRARPEWDIELLEKNSQLGGRLATADEAGFRFDTGPSLLLAPDIYRETFEGIGPVSQLLMHQWTSGSSPKGGAPSCCGVHEMALNECAHHSAGRETGRLCITRAR